MEIKKNLESMKNRIAGQVASRIQKVDLDSLLGAIGLQVVKRSKGMSLPLLTAFGSGIAVGALFAPMPGKDLRAKVALLLGKLKKSQTDGDGPHELNADGQAIESPYDKAAKTQHEPGGSNGQRKGVRPIEVSPPIVPSTP